MQLIESKLLDIKGNIKENLLLQEIKTTFTTEKFNIINSAISLLKKTFINEKHQIINVNIYNYALEIAYILFSVKADEEAISAGILYYIYNKELITDEQILKNCNKNVLKILNGTKEMTSLKVYQASNISIEQIHTFRKMLLTIIEDVRIVLVKIVDKLCIIRNIKNIENSLQKSIAKEILDIYAPLANRLGLFQIKWELEDRAFNYLYNDDYKKIAKSLGEKRKQREKYLNKVISVLENEIKKQNLDAKVSGRIKHIYSIWRKLNKKNYKSIARLFDIRAIRVIANNIDDCYKVLAIVNNLWLPIADEFDDYIANPKPNGYKSIHTVVTAYNKSLEVQIRTEDMHQESELGFAAHWRYKEGVKFDPSYDAKVIWLRSLLEWGSQINFIDRKLTTQLNERIYVFTPTNELIELSQNSTVLDFAYSVHTLVGHRTKGAKVNEKIVPLTTKLKNGDKIEILTHKLPQPSKDWATESLGFLSSARNRSRVVKWFNELNKEENISLGKERLQKELKAFNLKQIDYKDVAHRFNMQSVDTLFASVENGNIRLASLINHIVDTYSEKIVEFKRGASTNQKLNKEKKIAKVLISGNKGMKYELGKCCNPTINDNIIGYMSVTRQAVVVHSLSCSNLNYLKNNYKERLIDVEWED